MSKIKKFEPQIRSGKFEIKKKKVKRLMMMDDKVRKKKRKNWHY
jgi:hypothetical protein